MKTLSQLPWSPSDYTKTRTVEGSVEADFHQHHRD
jgi:hypothetical protein